MVNLIVTTSWDDGSKLDLRLIALLNKYGLKGTFYIPTEYLNCSLEISDVKEIAKTQEIGAHTSHHLELDRVSLTEARSEIEDNKAYLEDIIGRKVITFCYPRGKYSPSVKELVKSAGFLAARTTKYGSFDQIKDPFEWQITMQASNASPRKALGICLKTGIPVTSLLDWEIRAKLLFDLAFEKAGIYHLWGHSWEFERKHEWDKLDRVFSYISHREGIKYLTNGEIFTRSIGSESILLPCNTKIRQKE